MIWEELELESEEEDEQEKESPIDFDFLSLLSNPKDYYKILAVDYDANDETIRSNYIRLALKWHPDKKKGEENATSRFQEINEAYKVLSDPSKRREYDRKGVLFALDYNAMVSRLEFWRNIKLDKLTKIDRLTPLGRGLPQSLQGFDIDMQWPGNQIFSVVTQHDGGPDLHA